MLPVEYIQLSYIESTGTQYLDTGYLFKTNSRIDVDFQFSEYGGQERILGNADYEGQSVVTIYVENDLILGYALADDVGYGASMEVNADTERHLYSLDNFQKKVEMDEGRTFTSSIVGISQDCTTSILLMGNRISGSVVQLSSGRLYGAKIYESGQMVHNFVPVTRIEDGLAGVYDLVEEKFIGGSGGDFVAGKAMERNPDNRVLYGVQYDIEIWDWKTNQYLADISNILVDGMSMNWILNDVESLDFEIDLVQFEKKCSSMGVTPDDLLKPYVHDIRVRRNGEYILGCQVVEASINIQNDAPITIRVRCTGFLNLFKDQYISEPMAGYTYPLMAHKLISRAQHSDILIKNPTFDIDSSYWLAASGSLARVTDKVPCGAGSLRAWRDGTGWIGVGSQMRVPAGTPIRVDVWLAGQPNRPIYIRERDLINHADNQGTICEFVPSAQSTFEHFSFTGSYTTKFDNGYILIETNRTDPAPSLRVDNCFVYRVDDEDSLHNLNVPCVYGGLTDVQNGEGHNYAISDYSSNRQYNYELQNVKDALMELTQMEDDHFDFEFLPDRTFNTYKRKGGNKPEIAAVYPGNIHSMTIERTAANLTNRLIGIGSGIGDERLEVYATRRDSREMYGTRESIITSNNVSILSSLTAEMEGAIDLVKEPTNLPRVVIRDGSINPGNIKTGDTIIVQIANGDSYLNSINGQYRIMEIDVQVNLENVEEVSLSLEAV